MWIIKSIVLLAFVSLYTALQDTASSNCPDKCKCEADGSIVRCPGKTTLKDWFRIGSTIRENVIQLEITFADFTRLSVFTFKKLPNLAVLRIQEGRLTSFPKGLSKPFPHLQQLIILKNQITDIPRSAVKDLRWLEFLIMYKNRLTKLTANNFKGMNSLRVISFVDNKIKYLHRDSFAGLKNLFVVLLEGNELVNLPIGLFNFKPVHQQEMFFMFRRNKIQEIRKDIFMESSYKIKLLDFSFNQITKIEQGAFDTLQAAPNNTLFLCNNPIVNNACTMSLLDFSKVKLNIKTKCP